MRTLPLAAGVFPIRRWHLAILAHDRVIMCAQLFDLQHLLTRGVRSSIAISAALIAPLLPSFLHSSVPHALLLAYWRFGTAPETARRRCTLVVPAAEVLCRVEVMACVAGVLADFTAPLCRAACCQRIVVGPPWHCPSSPAAVFLACVSCALGS
jgi:hypothetical protein